MAQIQRVLRPAQRGAFAARQQLMRPLSTSTALHARVSHVPPPPPPQAPREMAVGEIEGLDFKIQPMRRAGEDEKTMRARLVYQSRKRGTLESDLLLSTFADANLPRMDMKTMAEYDRFLDENDWDIYYWATQDPPDPEAKSKASSPPPKAAEKKSSAQGWTPKSPFAQAVAEKEIERTQGKEAAAAAAAAASEEPYRNPGDGEWANTVGKFEAAYRPVPERWQGSTILEMLRKHVKAKSKGGADGTGMGFMPDLRTAE